MPDLLDRPSGTNPTRRPPGEDAGPEPAGGHGLSVYLDDLRRGDSDAVGEIARRWLPRVERALERKLRGLRLADAEGVASSVFLSLWNHAGGGRFGAGTLADSDELWRWLMRVADSKAIDYARRERAAKRGGGRTRGEGSVWRSDGDGGPSAGLDSVGSRDLTPAEQAAFAETFEQLMGALPNDLTREVVVGRLEARTSTEMATELGVSPKTVKRKLAGVRDLVRLGALDLAAPEERTPPPAGA